MRFKRQSLLFGAFLAVWAVQSGCGILGDKPGLDKVLRYAGGSAGCLNEFGPNFERYLRGEIAVSEWEATWDCAIDSIDLFREFVRPSSEAGYSRQEIKDLVANLLVTNAEITDELIEATFQLKASIFGGTDRHVSSADLEVLMGLLQLGKSESIGLIPHLANRARNARPDQMRGFATALEKGASVLAAGLPSGSGARFTAEAARTLLEELSRMHGWKIPPKYADLVISAKGVFTGGRQDRIERWEWSELIRLAGKLGGAAAAVMSVDRQAMTGPNEFGRFMVEMSSSVRAALLRSIDLHGGAVSAGRLDQVIDALPSEVLPLSRETAKRALRPVLSKIVRPRPVDFRQGDESEPGLDQTAIETVFEWLGRWSRGQTLIETVFDSYGLDPMGVVRQRLMNSLDEYIGTLDEVDRDEGMRIASLVAYYQPLFAGNDRQITFAPNVRHSVHHLSLVHLINLLGERLIDAYSSVRGRQYAVADDLKTLIDDFGQVGFELKLLETDVPLIHERRFTEADMFTYASNGDGFLSLEETTYYFLYLYSASNLSRGRILSEIQPECGGDTYDPLGFSWMEVSCFRSRFMLRLPVFLDFFPQLERAYSRLTVPAKRNFENSLEIAARRHGLSDQPVASFDADGFAGILHYVETVFSRFDVNNDQYIDLDESMRAYPLFKRLLAQVGGVDPNNDVILKAAFTYTLKHGHPPETDTVSGMVRFLAWVAWRPFWRFHTDRHRLVRIFAALVEPEPVSDSPDSGVE